MMEKKYIFFFVALLFDKKIQASLLYILSNIVKLWGEYFEENTSEQKIKKIINKINNPKSPKQVSETVLKSDKITLEDYEISDDGPNTCLAAYRNDGSERDDLET